MTFGWQKRRRGEKENSRLRGETIFSWEGLRDERLAFREMEEVRKKKKIEERVIFKREWGVKERRFQFVFLSFLFAWFTG